MISCALDEQGLREQHARQRRLAPSVISVVRDGGAMHVEFAPGFDRPLLDEMVEVEKQCCPFFRFAFDERARRLTIGVAEPEYAPAVEAIAAALGAAR
jgi:hypothetical protein